MYSIPRELEDLTLIEKLLIQRISPFVPLEHMYKGTMGLRGHVCAFHQGIKGIATILPRLPSDVSIVRIVREMKGEIGCSSLRETKAYHVNKERVIRALRWLKKFNPEYADITITETNLDWVKGAESDVTQFIDVLVDATDLVLDDSPVLNDFGPSGVPPEIPDHKVFGCVDDGTLENLSAETKNHRGTLSSSY